VQEPKSFCEAQKTNENRDNGPQHGEVLGSLVALETPWRKRSSFMHAGK